MNFKAVLFDMDGLIIDSEPFWRAAHVSTLKKHGVAIHEDDVRKMAGKRTDEVVQHWRKVHKLEHVPSDSIESDVTSKVIESIRKKGTALPGAIPLMKLLKEHDVPMAIASSSAQNIIDAVIEILGLGKYIHLAYSAKNEPQGKPHPGVFLTAAKLLGAHPSECIVLEDAVSGVRAAKSAQMRCIAIPEQANIGKPEFMLADAVLPSLECVSWDLLNHL